MVAISGNAAPGSAGTGNNNSFFRDRFGKLIAILNNSSTGNTDIAYSNDDGKTWTLFDAGNLGTLTANNAITVVGDTVFTAMVNNSGGKTIVRFGAITITRDSSNGVASLTVASKTDITLNSAATESIGVFDMVASSNPNEAIFFAVAATGSFNTYLLRFKNDASYSDMAGNATSITKIPNSSTTWGNIGTVCLHPSGDIFGFFEKNDSLIRYVKLVKNGNNWTAPSGQSSFTVTSLVGQPVSGGLVQGMGGSVSDGSGFVYLSWLNGNNMIPRTVKVPANGSFVQIPDVPSPFPSCLATGDGAALGFVAGKLVMFYIKGTSDYTPAYNIFDPATQRWATEVLVDSTDANFLENGTVRLPGDSEARFYWDEAVSSVFPGFAKYTTVTVQASSRGQQTVGFRYDLRLGGPEPLRIGSKTL
jgi:hypothetical protein